MATTATVKNERLREALVRIEAKAQSTLAHQTDNEMENGIALERAIKAIGEIIGATVVVAIGVIAATMFCLATPDQMPGEPCYRGAMHAEVAQ